MSSPNNADRYELKPFHHRPPGGAPAESYKSLFDKTASHLANKTQKGFSSENLQKASDRVDPEARENVKRFLQKMIRNIDSY